MSERIENRVGNLLENQPENPNNLESKKNHELSERDLGVYLIYGVL